LSHPLQNRVTPFGEVIAHTARGTFMGNRGGRFHDPSTKTLLKNRWASKQWIICTLEFKNRHRTVMGESYTELFFLDAATALAAGHRPCFECRRKDALAFRAAWRVAHDLSTEPKANEMDQALHIERLDGHAKRHWPIEQPPPPGAMIAHDNTAFLITTDGYKPWTMAGYGNLVTGSVPENAVLLTPPSIVATLRAGYVIEH